MSDLGHEIALVKQKKKSSNSFGHLLMTWLMSSVQLEVINTNHKITSCNLTSKDNSFRGINITYLPICCKYMK